MNKSIESYELKKEALYGYKLANVITAARAYRDACHMTGALYDRLSLVRFCANTMGEISALDALAVADVIIGEIDNK